MADAKISDLADGGAVQKGDLFVVARGGGDNRIAGSELGVKYRKVTAKQLVSSVTETDLLNGEITLAAGVLGSDRIARIVLWGDFLQNTGVDRGGPTLKLKYGGSTLFAFDVA